MMVGVVVGVVVGWGNVQKRLWNLEMGKVNKPPSFPLIS